MAKTLVSGDPFRPPGLRREAPPAVLGPCARLAHEGARPVPSGDPEAQARLPSGPELEAR